MLLARVEGNVVSTRKHPSFQGWRLLICQPISGRGEPEGVPVVAIDPHGAALHQRAGRLVGRSTREGLRGSAGGGCIASSCHSLCQ